MTRLPITETAVALVLLLICCGGSGLVAQDCSDPSKVNVDIRTGIDEDGDGLDDHWQVRRGSQTEFQPAPVREVSGWRGAASLDPQPFGFGRYPVLGDGRWIVPDFLAEGLNVFRRTFILEGGDEYWIAAEWGVDNFLRVFLNGFEVDVQSTPNLGAFGPEPPSPWLSNRDGASDECASPVDGLLHPNCDGRNEFCDRTDYRCLTGEDEFREIHYFELSSRANPEWFLEGENVIEIEVRDVHLVEPGETALLLTGGVGTSLLTGASAGPCPPVRACGALPGDPPPPCDCEMTIELDRVDVLPGEELELRVELLHRRSAMAIRPLSIRVEDPRGQVVVEHSTPPVTFEYAVPVSVRRTLALPPELAPGEYTVTVGLPGMRQGLVRRSHELRVLAAAAPAATEALR